MGLASILCRFCCLGHYWLESFGVATRALGLPLLLEWALMFVFLILAAATGGWTVGVCMVCPANTERSKKPACHKFWSLLG